MNRRVVLDTNILVSALLSPDGNAAAILGMVADGQLQAIYCPRILDEYTLVLTRRRFAFPHARVEKALDIFRVYGISIHPIASDCSMPDESDRIFYDTALTASAMLITGNRKHYPANSCIITPADFIHAIRG